MGEGFYLSIRNYLRGWNILEVDLLSNYLITNIMVLDVNMLSSNVIDSIIGEGNQSLIIIFE